MKYQDLIQFDPIESVVQLRDANKADEARQLVASYVISDEMAERLISIVFRQLQFEKPADNKGLFIVGNYGTGKSHLMSVITSISENASLVKELTNPSVATAAGSIAGKFKVVRTEVGSTGMDLRDFICSQLETSLASWNVDYRFPARDRIPNHKGAFEDMMAAFQQVYPDKGILFVVDEFLEYLRMRRDQELIVDLSFLREMGEVCKDLRFRFIAGVQEKIIGSDYFGFAHNELDRVRARFEEVLIVRQDVKFVVAERLLKKTAHQQAIIRENLAPFTKFYNNMNEQLDDFVRLYPIHPDFFLMFERVRAGEKREAFKVVSVEMRKLLEQEVPTDQPGLVSYDAYWLNMKQTFRANPDVKAISDIVDILQGRLEQAMSRKSYLPMARRLINALALNRLTTGDIELPLGVTPEELRDGLALFDTQVAELGGEPAEDLLTQVETVLSEIIKTVSGQFISFNKQNRQYYLDLKKTDDYDALIDKRIASLSDDTRDRYYSLALMRALELDVNETVASSGYRIWQDELEWPERKTTRLGYLFFGAPNERSTAKPPRDFYIYFLRPYSQAKYSDSHRDDEVFFRLKKTDEPFTQAMDHYAAAEEQATSASGQAKTAYRNRAEGYFNQLVKWLQENLGQAYEVTYQGKTRSVLEWNKTRFATGVTRSNVRDLVRSVSASCLSTSFADRWPEYPTFTVLITGKNRPQAAQDALRWIKQPFRSQQAVAVLDALGLLDGEKIVPANSIYARFILEKLNQKGSGQVLNRDELLDNDAGLIYLKKYHLEPEWIVVLLVALVYSGEIVLTVPGNKKFDPTNFDLMMASTLAELQEFKHIEKPKDWNFPALSALFELVRLTPGMAFSLANNDNSVVTQLLGNLGQLVQELVTTQHLLQTGGLYFWDQPLLSQDERDRYPQSMEQTKKFLEGVQPFNTPAKLKNFRLSADEVNAQKGGLQSLSEVQALQRLVAELEPATGYLSKARLALPENHEWVGQVQAARAEIVNQMLTPAKRSAADFRQEVLTKLNKLKKDYQSEYVRLHSRHRLDDNGKMRKQTLENGNHLSQLNRLVVVDLMPRSQLTEFKAQLSKLKDCTRLTNQDLESGPVCPHCGYKPATETQTLTAQVLLQQLEQQLEDMYQTFLGTLRKNLQDPLVQRNQTLLSAEEKRHIEPFIQSGELPFEISQGFLQTFKQLFQGLDRVEVRMSELYQRLLGDGSPTVQDDLRQRFETYLKAKMGSRDPKTVRLVIEDV